MPPKHSNAFHSKPFSQTGSSFDGKSDAFEKLNDGKQDDRRARFTGVADSQNGGLFDEDDMGFGTGTIVGTCELMCPIAERDERERFRALSVFETVPGTGSSRVGDYPKVDPARVVKKYKRAAAANAVDPTTVRPDAVQQHTTMYLQQQVLDGRVQPGQPQHEVALFISDRFRAIKKDYECQGISTTSRAEVLERIARYHIIVGYLLGEEQLERFNPRLNVTAATSTLTSLFHQYKDKVPSSAVVEMHAYNLQYSINTLNFSENLNGLPAPVARHPVIGVIRKLYVAIRSGMWHDMWKQQQEQPLLCQCVFVTCLPKLRSNMVKCLIRGYSDGISVSLLAKMVRLDEAATTVLVLSSGYMVEDSKVQKKSATIEHLRLHGIDGTKQQSSGLIAGDKSKVNGVDVFLPAAPSNLHQPFISSELTQTPYSHLCMQEWDINGRSASTLKSRTSQKKVQIQNLKPPVLIKTEKMAVVKHTDKLTNFTVIAATNQSRSEVDDDDNASIAFKFSKPASVGGSSSSSSSSSNSNSSKPVDTTNEDKSMGFKFVKPAPPQVTLNASKPTQVNTSSAVQTPKKAEMIPATLNSNTKTTPNTIKTTTSTPTSINTTSTPPTLTSKSNHTLSQLKTLMMKNKSTTDSNDTPPVVLTHAQALQRDSAGRLAKYLLDFKHIRKLEITAVLQAREEAKLRAEAQKEQEQARALAIQQADATQRARLLHEEKVRKKTVAQNRVIALTERARQVSMTKKACKQLQTQFRRRAHLDRVADQYCLHRALKSMRIVVRDSDLRREEQRKSSQRLIRGVYEEKMPQENKDEEKDQTKEVKADYSLSLSQMQPLQLTDLNLSCDVSVSVSSALQPVLFPYSSFYTHNDFRLSSSHNDNQNALFMSETITPSMLAAVIRGDIQSALRPVLNQQNATIYHHVVNLVLVIPFSCQSVEYQLQLDRETKQGPQLVQEITQYISQHFMYLCKECLALPQGMHAGANNPFPPSAVLRHGMQWICGKAETVPIAKQIVKNHPPPLDIMSSPAMKRRQRPLELADTGKKLRLDSSNNSALVTSDEFKDYEEVIHTWDIPDLTNTIISNPIIDSMKPKDTIVAFAQNAPPIDKLLLRAIESNNVLLRHDSALDVSSLKKHVQQKIEQSSTPTTKMPPTSSPSIINDMIQMLEEELASTSKSWERLHALERRTLK